VVHVADAAHVEVERLIEGMRTTEQVRHVGDAARGIGLSNRLASSNMFSSRVTLLVSKLTAWLKKVSESTAWPILDDARHPLQAQQQREHANFRAAMPPRARARTPQGRETSGDGLTPQPGRPRAARRSAARRARGGCWCSGPAITFVDFVGDTESDRKAQCVT
jgi:hypothetical protein